VGEILLFFLYYSVLLIQDVRCMLWQETGNVHLEPIRVVCGFRTFGDDMAQQQGSMFVIDNLRPGGRQVLLNWQGSSRRVSTYPDRVLNVAGRWQEFLDMRDSVHAEF
jgi:hypothetical protein